MVSDRAIFSISGPQHLHATDWRNTFHRRSVAASLVKGVYLLERDRQKCRQGPKAIAPPWWEALQFKLNRVLVDNVDLSFYGAIYELMFAPPHLYHFGQNQTPPRYVVAFRGTITKSKQKLDDFKLNFNIICNKLENCSRLQAALQEVRNLVAVAGAANVWLAGHSLGAAIALSVGKNLAKESQTLETYLFNPPFICPPIEKIKCEKLKHGVRFANSLITAGLAVAVNGHHKNDDQFAVLSKWAPYIFVNPSDPISSEYIGYFEHRETMAKIGAGRIQKLATKHSIVSLCSGVLGKDSEPSHLLPTAYLTVNLRPSQDFNDAHGIHQWWQQHFQWQSKLHRFN